MTTGMTSDPRPYAPRRFVLTTGGVAVVSALWYVLHAITGLGPPVLAVMASPIGSAIGAVAVVALFRAVPMAPAARRFWLLVLALEILVTAGRLINVAAQLQVYPDIVRIPPVASLCTGLGLLAAI